MKTRTVVILVTAIIFLSFGISTFSSIISMSTLIEKNSAKEAELFMREVQSEIVSSFSDSVSVSETINNAFIRDFIEHRDEYTDDEASRYIGTYLDGLKKQFGYDTAFLTIECTKEYFTEYGRNKVLDLKGEDDAWYPNFKNSNKKMELNVDNDQANENRITVYNNIRMEDDNGEFIGVCGVGHTLVNLNTSIDALEQKYALSILLSNPEGIVQVAGDDSLPGTEVKSYIRDYIVNYDLSVAYEYEKVGSGGYIIVKYIPEYNWYLCIESPEKLDEMTNVIMDNLLAALAALTIMVIIISIAMRYQANETLLFKADSETDTMTGLYNRRAFDNMFEAIKKGESIRDISIAVIDINGLKQVNDEKGHFAGDELIVKTAECIKELYEKHGKAFRIGGDEFAIVFTEPVDDVEDCIKQIRNRINKCELEYSDNLAVAIGVVRGEDHQDLEIEDLMELADKAMYGDKEEYYKDKRHERRAR